MAQKNGFLIENENFNSSESVRTSDIHPSEIDYHDNEGSRLKEHDSLSDEKMECDKTSESTLNSHQELGRYSEIISNDPELALAEEIAQRAGETLCNRIDYYENEGSQLKEQDSLSDEKRECDKTSESTLNSHQELGLYSEILSNDPELALAEEIAQTAGETLCNRIDYFNNEGSQLKEQDSLSDEKRECDKTLKSTLNSHQELGLYSEIISNDLELALAEEIAQTAGETLCNRIDYLDDKCMTCSKTLNIFFQYIYNELKVASMLKNWRRKDQLHNLLMRCQPYYNLLLMIMEALDGIQNIVKQHEDCLTKRIVNKMIRTFNRLEDIVDHLMSRFPEIH